MADNTELNSGSGGDTISTDDLGSVKVQRVKVQYGTDGNATDVSDTNPLPIDDAGGSITIDGTVTANLSETDNAVLDAIAADTGSMDTALATLAGAVSGSEIQVDIVSGSSSGTEYDEDAATPSTISGPTFMMERDDALSTLTPAAGDWAAARCDANGALWVNVSNADGTATDDAAYTAGSGSGVPIMGFVSADSVDSGDVGAVAMSTDRRLQVDADVTGTVDLGATDNAVLDSIASALGGTLTVSGTVTANAGSGTQAVSLASVPSHAVTNAGTFAVQAAQSGTWSVTNISGTVSLPTGASTASAQATQTTALQLIDNPIVAHDAAVSGSTGVNMAGFNARSSEPTAVASADATQGLATLLGKQVVQPFAIPASTWSYASPAAVTDTSDDEAKAAAGAGVRNYITGVQVFNGHDSTGTEVVIKDGSTVLWRGWAEQTGGGCSATFNPPLRGTANTAVNVANITTGSSTYFNLQGYVAAE